jgi:hypothetical protein
MDLTKPILAQLKAMYESTSALQSSEITNLLLAKELVVLKGGSYVVNDEGIYELIGAGLLKDLFEFYDEQPKELADLCEPWFVKYEDGLSYHQCAEWLKEVNAIGFTFHYYRDADPTNLVKMPAGHE